MGQDSPKSPGFGLQMGDSFVKAIALADAPAQSGLFLDGDKGLGQLLCVDDGHVDSSL